ncbi:MULTISPECIES: hypothetical protein [unclassified Prochlorococcus]|uniref:hypothetical protein n=1 Tax=unclassified Prochlorococcus TaxID=2627481 RepID=UPI0039A6CACC
MTTINTDYNNTELLDQELTTTELSEVSGGLIHNPFDTAPAYDPVYGGLIELLERVFASSDDVAL